MSEPRSTSRLDSLDARPDSMDFRDQMFVPTLIQVDDERLPDDFIHRHNPPILDQGSEGACTGYGLAAVCHVLFRVRADDPLEKRISPRMLYEMAKRYDEWEGEDYSGSSARGAMKGWHKHGVCSENAWPGSNSQTRLTIDRADDATRRPLGAYFRVDHTDLVAMHSALAEVGILYATGMVHQGWDKVGDDGIIPVGDPLPAGHAFAIIGYDRLGFWIQNSWGTDWGYKGFGRISYADWMENGTDVWVARNGVPIQLTQQLYSNAGINTIAQSSLSFGELRPHVVTIGNEGIPGTGGTFGNTAADIDEIFQTALPRITGGWGKKRILVYAHGGLTPEKPALKRVENFVRHYTDNEVYMLSFIWRTDLMTTIKNILEDARRSRKSEGFLDSAKDFLLDRLDDAIEPVARNLGGMALWSEMKENAERSSNASNGGARQVADHLARLAQDPSVEIHLVGHSAGSIFLAFLADYLGQQNVQLKSCTLWAAACTVELFKQTYLPLIQSGQLESTTLFNLTTDAEKDDNCYHIYNKSLLYLVSHAFEKTPRIPLFRGGVPLLGMNEWVEQDKELKSLIESGKIRYVLAPNQFPSGSVTSSLSKHHGDFDDDKLTIRATMTSILGT